MAQVEIPPGLPEEIVVGFSRCHQIETWLRELVYLETKAHYGDAYWQECEAALKRANGRFIPPEHSMKRDRQHPHMATGENDPLWFLSFDMLLKILFDDNLWPCFETYLTTKRLLQAKLEEVAIVRNRIAHYRNLHRHDLDRTLFLLRELDQGFFNFCASYGTHHGFYNADLKRDPIHEYFTQVGGRRNKEIILDAKWTMRPSADQREAFLSGRGRLYCIVIYSRFEARHYFDFREILRLSSSHHEHVAHILLDTGRRFFRVIFPAVLGPEIIIKSAEFFYDLCENCGTGLLRDLGPVPDRLEGENEKEYHRRKIEAHYRIFDGIALEWPHYVVPPSHPYTFLDLSCTPCNFFGA